MKKVINSILGFFDKILIIPMTKLILKIRTSMNASSWRFEAWLSKSNTLLYISLIIAIVTFVVVDQKILVYSENSAEVLKNQPVKVIYNDEAYVVEGLPSVVDVTLIGTKSNLYFAKQSESHSITVDLSDLKPGQHKVDVTYDNILPSLEYSVNPSTVTVIIYAKVSATKSLAHDLLHIDELDSKLNIDSVTLDADQVVIKGSEQQIAKVATVKALIDVNNFDVQSVGTLNLKNVQLKAYDASGNVVDVETVPSKINAVVEISSPSKELAIKVIPTGSVTFGKAISAIETSVTKVVAYGSAEVLNNLEYIPVEIDVTNMSESIEKKLEIVKPTGINSLSVGNVTVKVTIADSSNRDIENVPVSARNSGDGLVANIVDTTFITVAVQGVTDVIKDMQPSDITAYVDCTDLKAGEYELDVKVEGSDVKASYISKTLKVKVVITAKKQ